MKVDSKCRLDSYEHSLNLGKRRRHKLWVSVGPCPTPPHLHPFFTLSTPSLSLEYSFFLSFLLSYYDSIRTQQEI